MKKETFLSLTELGAIFPEYGRGILSKCASVHDVLPWHTVPGKSQNRRYYLASEVKRTLKALDVIRAKEIPLKFAKRELMDSHKWYRELRERENDGKQ